MGSNIVVKLENVSKYYKLYDSPKDRLKEALHPFRKRYHKEFYALNNISFELKKGECLGIIGKNGMGKSTLLKLIAHIIEPSSGTIQVNGTVSAILELGTGFNPEFSGIENIYFYGTILGFKKQEIEHKVKEIVDFAYIGEYIDQPVKFYSSGMFVRLAFSVQTSLEPDILIVDEVLSVGDIFFQQKCHARIEKLLSKGTSLIIVSHDMQLIEKYSNHVLLINEGQCIEYGCPNDVVYAYYRLEDKSYVKNKTAILSSKDSSNNAEQLPRNKIAWPKSEVFINSTALKILGDRETANCNRVALCNSGLQACDTFFIGESAHLFYEIEIFQDIGIPYGIVTVINSKNIIIHAKDTLQYYTSKDITTPLKIGSKLMFSQSFDLDIAIGEYTFSMGFGYIEFEDAKRIREIDYKKRGALMKNVIGMPHALKFKVRSNRNKIAFPFHGYVDLKGDYSVELIG